MLLSFKSLIKNLFFIYYIIRMLLTVNTFSIFPYEKQLLKQPKVATYKHIFAEAREISLG